MVLEKNLLNAPHHPQRRKLVVGPAALHLQIMENKNKERKTKSETGLMDVVIGYMQKL